MTGVYFPDADATHETEHCAGDKSRFLGNRGKGKEIQDEMTQTISIGGWWGTVASGGLSGHLCLYSGVPPNSSVRSPAVL